MALFCACAYTVHRVGDVCTELVSKPHTHPPSHTHTHARIISLATFVHVYCTSACLTHTELHGQRGPLYYCGFFFVLEMPTITISPTSYFTTSTSTMERVAQCTSNSTTKSSPLLYLGTVASTLLAGRAWDHMNRARDHLVKWAQARCPNMKWLLLH